MKILIIGANGMLGHVLYSELKKYGHDVWGSVRSNPFFPEYFNDINISSQKSDLDKIDSTLKKIKPDVVINCVGIIKQLKESKDSIPSLEVNSLFPHLLAGLCKANNCKMIHFSTDCIFLGDKENYTEESVADARDLYGLSKYMGEVSDSHCLTIRTSIIGHELNSNVSLVDWFLSQKDECLGFTEAIYSGLPTVEIAKMLNEKILAALSHNELNGVYQLSSEPINKYELLKLIAEVYQKNINITPSKKVIINRSLDSSRLRNKILLEPRSWKAMITSMREQFIQSGFYNTK